MIIVCSTILILFSVFILIEKIIFTDIFDSANLLAKDQLLNIKLDILEKIMDDSESLSNRYNNELKYINYILKNFEKYSLTYILCWNFFEKNNQIVRNHFLILNNNVVEILLTKIINQNVFIFVVNKLSYNYLYNKIKTLLISLLINNVIYKI